VILGLERPTSGTVTVGGQPYADLVASLRHVGSLLDAGAVQPGCSASEHLLALASSNGIGRRRVGELLESSPLPVPSVHPRPLAVPADVPPVRPGSQPADRAAPPEWPVTRFRDIIRSGLIKFRSTRPGPLIVAGSLVAGAGTALFGANPSARRTGQIAIHRTGGDITGGLTGRQAPGAVPVGVQRGWPRPPARWSRPGA
jgi:hypothetical protein